MTQLPTTTDPEDLDELLREHLPDIEALVAAIMAEMPDCDLKLAAMLEGETESVRLAIIRELRKRLKALAEEKEKELEKFLEQEKRVEIERKRGMFMQWLQWIMSEEALRKMREAFLAVPILERSVRGIGHDMAGRGMGGIQPGDKRQLGELGTNVPDVRDRARERGEDKGRS